MPINRTDPQTGRALGADFAGRVVDVREFEARRNMSDTLDYTDFRTVRCREALVYIGRRGKPSPWEAERDLAVHERLRWVDCSNHFSWRGCDVSEPVVDAAVEGELAEDLAAWEAEARERALEAERRRIARESLEAEEAARREANRPAVGKPMVVVSGRRVKPGFRGTVAHVSGSGSVLLKPDDRWRDRSADGVWVRAEHLAARP